MILSFFNFTLLSTINTQQSTINQRFVCINISIEYFQIYEKKLKHFFNSPLKAIKNNVHIVNINDTLEQYTQDIYDLNELINVGKKCQSCPYYAAKELSLQADIVCTPYQLLMESIEQYIEPIIIVDEAHNFGSALLQTESCEISLNQLNIIIGGIEDYRKKYHQRVKAKTLYYLNQLYLIFKLQYNINF